VRGAFDRLLKASSINGARSGGDDSNTQLLVAVVHRDVFITSSVYLTTALADNPATPAGLAAAVKKLSDLYQVITLDGYMGDRNDPGHDAVNKQVRPSKPSANEQS
jgi:hypothetical protein